MYITNSIQQFILSVTETKYGVETKYLKVDFSMDGEENYTKISNLLKDLDVGILVNNVGIGCTSLFLDVPSRSEFLSKAININIKPTFKASIQIEIVIVT